MFKLWKNITFLKKVMIGCVIAWMVVAILPWIALVCPWFTFEHTNHEKFKDILTQLGTYGDMFGGLGVLFSGFALIAVAYSINLQIEDRKGQEHAQNKANYLNAIIALTQAYTQRYAGNMEDYEMDFRRAEARGTNDEKDPTDKRYTVLGRLLHYTDELSGIEKQLTETGDFQFPPNKEKKPTPASDQPSGQSG